MVFVMFYGYGVQWCIIDLKRLSVSSEIVSL